MSSKRRQTGSEGAIDSSFSATSTPSPFKRVKPGSTAPKHHDSGYSDEDCLSQPSKKVRLLAQVKREAQDYSPPAHKLVAKSKRRTSSDGPVSRSSLIPRGERKRATVGQIDESVLRMVCDDSATGEVKELHYRNMLHSTIDWNNAEHINKINNWRNQIYGRAGLKAKTVTVWLDEEELWFELYHQLSIAESRTRGILLPSTFAIREAFNNTFDGQVLQYKGKALEPRGERQPNAFASKFNRMCPQLRARSYMCTWGKSGDVYVPKITFGMLKKYQRMRQEMERKGLKDESAYSEGLEEWLYLFSHLPDSEDDDVQEEYRPAEEVDAAAALISFATQAFGGKKVVKIEGQWFAYLLLLNILISGMQMTKLLRRCSSCTRPPVSAAGPFQSCRSRLRSPTQRMLSAVTLPSRLRKSAHSRAPARRTSCLLRMVFSQTSSALDAALRSARWSSITLT